ncbi:pyruvate dehydrogenase E2 component (dihydrolipoamide acetyltransferase) [Nocardioides salarius]|uniref:Dihydrolipoamide acetyltransferase component of pyruvate dehydrogenase complex n=1 Tax=Nocardioides salarius TaxID=374513 RepID=A0ABS2MBC6_9ACTN|nr:2-oxo acid dehydrogenase subunit E2 [Nocardioides salarius]MBM7508504.1 pyruvate dehydrogenase E2 component (dihydrolipoamide acetyltransferase) [Nocardioides salarius]
MAHVLRMPGVAANDTEAVLAEWIVQVGADFAGSDVLATVETDKAAVDIEADDAGVVLHTLVPPGAQVEIGSPIAVLGAPGEQVDDLDALLAELGVAEATDPVVPERRDVPTDPESGAPLAEPSAPAVEERAPTVVEEGAPAPVSKPNNGRIFASPLARKIAKDAGIPVEEIHGSGPRGRILRRDVDAAVAARADQPTTPLVEQRAPASVAETPTTPLVEQRAPASVAETPAPTKQPPPTTEAAYTDTPHSRMRRAVANRLQESKREAPHFYLRASLRVDKLIALRAELNDGATTRVSLNDLVVKAVAAAHERVPEMNVVWTAEATRAFSTSDIAVAVATDRGLLTPVVRDVGSLSVTALAARVADLAARAREGKLKQDELEGGSMSVTNLGMYGVEEFAAIINPPHAAILAVGAAREEAVVEDGQLVVGQVMRVTLSVDHRPVDGVVAAKWLAAFSDLVEHPLRILA